MRLYLAEIISRRDSAERKSTRRGSFDAGRASASQDEKRASRPYDRPMQYQNIQNISDKVDGAGVGTTTRVAPLQLSSKVVSVHPNSSRRASSSNSGSVSGRRETADSRRSSLEKRALTGIHELSTVYTH